MTKYICMLLMLLMTSGCCELFGLCTSVNVHTSADSPDKVASADLRGGSESARDLQVPLRSSVLPADARSVGNEPYLTSINNRLPACS